MIRALITRCWRSSGPGGRGRAGAGGAGCPAGRLASAGLVKAGGKQRTDSTHVVAAVAALNRLELAGESVRAALEALAAAHPDWVEQRICVPDLARRYGTPMTSWRPPVSQARRDELAIAYARDGYALLEAVWDRSAPGWLRGLPAVEVLRRVLLQNYTRTITGGKEVIKRREKEPEGDGLPPGHARIASPYDTDARWGVKREEFWLGYKLHITETCDDPPPCTCRPAAAAQPAAGSAAAGAHDKDCARLVFPNLITNVATTDATVTDNQMTEPVHDALAARNLAPGRHYADSGYASAALVVSALTIWGIALIAPLLADTSAQARAGHGYARADFAVDYDARTVTCPQGKTTASWTPCTQHGKDAIVATFSAGDCGPCPARGQCTTGTRRQLSLLPRNLAEAQAAARTAEKTTRFQADYARRAGVEGTMQPGRQPRSTARPVPRPGQDPPRPRVHGDRPQPPPPGGLLDRHAAGPAANQPPGTPRTRPCRIEPELTTRVSCSVDDQRSPPSGMSSAATLVRRRLAMPRSYQARRLPGGGHDRRHADRPGPAGCGAAESGEGELIEVTFSPAEPQLTPGAARAVLAMLLRARERADHAED